MAGEIELTDEAFEQQVIKHKGVAVVDFFATWCGPCKRFGPIFQEFAAEAPAGVVAAKADVDQCPQAAAQQGVMSVPTVIIFKDGAAVERLVGTQSKADLLAKVKALMAKG
jgi:thioredoxin 1